MRYAKYAAIVILILAIPASFMYGKRYEASRVAMQINGQVISKRDLHIWLEDRWGPNMAAMMAQYFLLTQEARKDGWKPDPSDYQTKLEDARKANPIVATQLAREPWREAEDKQQMEMRSALVYLMTKDVKATDDELKEHFASKPGAWDTPEKLETQVLLVRDHDTAKQITTMWPGVNQMANVAGQFPNKVAPVGSDGTWVLTAGTRDALVTKLIAALDGAKDGEVRCVPINVPQFSDAVVKLQKRTPAAKATFEKAKDAVAQDYKLARATPAPEVLHKLWDNAKISTDPPSLRDFIELKLFPERVNQKQASATP